MRARHKKELKALEGNGRKLVKQANKNKANLAEAESKIAQVLSLRISSFSSFSFFYWPNCGARRDKAYTSRNGFLTCRERWFDLELGEMRCFEVSHMVKIGLSWS